MSSRAWQACKACTLNCLYSDLADEKPADSCCLPSLAMLSHYLKFGFNIIPIWSPKCSTLVLLTNGATLSAMVQHNGEARD